LLALTLSIGASRLGWVGGIQNVFDYSALPLLCYFFARNVFRRPRHLHWLAIGLALIVAALGFIAAREQLTNQAVLSPLPYRWEYGQHSVKVTSLFGAPAIMAMTLALPLPFMLVAAMRSRDLAPRLLWFGALALGGTGLLLTYVRAGWLAAAVGLVTVVALSRRLRSAGLVLLLFALLAGLVLGTGLVDVRAIQERLQAERPIEYRMNAITVGLEIARQAPLLRLGLDNYSDAAVASGWRPVGATGALAVAPHNLFIYVLTSGGLLAVGPLLAMYAAIGLRLLSVLRTVRDDRRDWAVAALGMLLSLLLIANTFDALGAQLANMLFFLAVGGTFALAEGPHAPEHQEMMEGGA
jgi:O-antigen ligase